MNSRLTEHQRDLLRARLLEQLGPDAPALRDEMERSEEFANELRLQERLLSLMKGIPGHEPLLTSPEVETAEQSLEPVIARTMRRLLSQPRASRARRFALAACAMLLLSLAVGVFLPALPERRPPRTLGGVLRPLAPVGSVEDFLEFRWDHERPPGATYQVRIYAAEDGLPSEEVFRTGRRLEEPRWVPDESARAKLPRSLFWQILVFGEGGTVIERSEPTPARLRAR